jgi:uncharacterized protein (DUF1330 family)
MTSAKGYILIEIEVTDPAQYARYTAHTPRVIAQYGGRFAIRRPQMEVLEGEPDGRAVVLLEFPSVEAARTFWTSPEYTDLKRVREGAAKFTARLLPGFDPDTAG